MGSNQVPHNRIYLLSHKVLVGQMSSLWPMKVTYKCWRTSLKDTRALTKKTHKTNFKKHFQFDYEKIIALRAQKSIFRQHI